MNRIMGPVELAALVRLDGGAPDALSVQVYRSLRDAIGAGRLAPGSTLVSSREAALALGVSRNTVTTAYDLLRAEGMVETRPGAAPRVPHLAPAPPPEPAPAGEVMAGLSERGAVLARDVRARLYARREGALAPGNPDPALFPADAWARALRRAARLLPGAATGYADYAGLARLRGMIAARLGQDRGLAVAPDQVLIIPGTQAGLALVAQALGDPGDVALVEDPGYPGARAAFEGAGLEVRSLPVDASGADLAQAGDAARARLIYVTPGNQYPLGGRMPMARRVALIAHAASTGSLIVEDDYDAEFLWRGRGLPALAALGSGAEVIHVGTFAKSLMPALRVGWLAVPAGLAAPLRTAHRNLGLAVPVHVQAALADFMDDGHYRAHLRRITRTYAARERLLAEALAPLVAADLLVLHRPDGGLKMAVEFTAPVDEAAVLADLARAGFAVAGLSGLCQSPVRAGLVVGFADADERRVTRFAAALASALGHAAR